MTETEMRELGCGSCPAVRTAEWNRKRDSLYKVLGVWETFRSHRSRHSCGFKGAGEKYFPSKAHVEAQKDVDQQLFKDAGVAVSEEREVGPVVGWDAIKAIVAKGDALDGLIQMSEFGKVANAEMDPIRDLTWVYNHMAIRDVKPSDAPSPGAYAHLKFIQKKIEFQDKFYTTVYPRIIPSKSVIENLNKFNDDGRANVKLLDRLEAEMGANPENEVSVLCFSLEDEPGSEDRPG